MAERKRTSTSTSAGEDNQSDDSKRVKLATSKARLVHLYGKNVQSNGKIKTVQQFRSGKDFKTTSQILNVAEATAEVYGIDAFAAGAPMDHVRLAEVLQVTEENFERIKSCIEKHQEPKLRAIRDELEEFSYNQIRFVLACMIRDLSL